MAEKRKVEIFSAGCAVCDDVISTVERIACPSCEVSVLDMRVTEVAERAQALGIRVVPAVVVDGRLASCCQGEGPNEAALRREGIGEPAA